MSSAEAARHLAQRFEARAQAAAEEAYERLIEEELEGGCACVTCTVREVLEAAWPHLRELAIHEQTTT